MPSNLLAITGLVLCVPSFYWFGALFLQEKHILCRFLKPLDDDDLTERI